MTDTDIPEVAAYTALCAAVCVLAAALSCGSAQAQGMLTQPNPCDPAKSVIVSCNGSVTTAWFAREPDRSWHLVVRLNSGAVQFTHQLTEGDCDTARLHALGRAATDDERRLVMLSDKSRLLANPPPICPPDPADKAKICVNVAMATPTAMLADIAVRSAECFQ